MEASAFPSTPRRGVADYVRKYRRRKHIAPYAQNSRIVAVRNLPRSRYETNCIVNVIAQGYCSTVGGKGRQRLVRLQEAERHQRHQRHQLPPATSHPPRRRHPRLPGANGAIFPCSTLFPPSSRFPSARMPLPSPPSACPPDRIFHWVVILEGSSVALGWFVNVVNEVNKSPQNPSPLTLTTSSSYGPDFIAHTANTRALLERLRRHSR